MKYFYIKNYGFWSVMVLVGIVLVAAGILQMADYQDKQNGGAGEPPPAPGEPVKTGAVVVQKQPKQTNEFFVEYRLERNRMRSQRIELIRELVNNPHTTEQDRSEAQRILIAISQAMDTEMKLENLIKAENFKDAAAFIQENSATVIVQTPVLTVMDKNKLTEITVRATGLRPENVVIISKS